MAGFSAGDILFRQTNILRPWVSETSSVTRAITSEGFRKSRLTAVIICREFLSARCGRLPHGTSSSDGERWNRSRASLNPAWS